MEKNSEKFSKRTEGMTAVSTEENLALGSSPSFHLSFLTFHSNSISSCSWAKTFLAFGAIFP